MRKPGQPRWEDVDWLAVYASKIPVSKLVNSRGEWEVWYVPNQPYDDVWDCHWWDKKKQGGGAQGWESIERMAEFTGMPDKLRVECENFATRQKQARQYEQTDFLAELGLEV